MSPDDHRKERVARVQQHRNDLCRTCGHDRVFHQVGTGNGVRVGQPYCSDRHGDDAAYNCQCKAFVPVVEHDGGIYLIGSLRNPRVCEVAAALRGENYDVFDDWYSPGPETDDAWQAYEKQRGRSFREALAGYHAQHAFALDKTHLDRSSAVVLVLPAGKSGHLELGYAIGQGKPGYILMDGEPERYDLMYNFATKVFTSVDELISHARTEGL